MERRHNLESKLREERIQIYNKILEPFIILFISQESWDSDPKHRKKDKNKLSTQITLSVEYRNYAFKLALIGSDGVVRAYNELMQLLYQFNERTLNEPELMQQTKPEWIQQTKKMLKMIGILLLEIRKSMGNESTKLDHWEMIEWFITDARKYRDEGV